MSMRPDPTILALERYFASEGEFAAYNRRGDPPAKAETVFVPFLESLSSSEQRRVTRLLADIAVGREPRSGGDRLQALDVLWYFTRPWPVDRRQLLAEVKSVILSEFDDEQN